MLLSFKIEKTFLNFIFYKRKTCGKYLTLSWFYLVKKRYKSAKMLFMNLILDIIVDVIPLAVSHLLLADALRDTFMRPSVFIFFFFLSLIEKITSYSISFKLYEVLIIFQKLCIINIVREREIISYFIQLFFIDNIEKIN